MPSGLDALEQMGLSSVLESIPHRPLDAWEVLIENRFLFRVDEPIEPGGKPCTLVSQPALLEALIDEASTYPNFEFIQGSPVQDLLWREQRVLGVKLGDDRSIYANLVIGADGRNSVVRQRANLSLEQQSGSFDILWFKLVDPQIQAEREPEIIRAQQLQHEEAAQAELLRKSALLRWAASHVAPLLGNLVRHSWLVRQRQLRQGITQIQLTV